MIIKHGWHNCWRNSRGAQRFVGFFLDCAFGVLIGWAGKLRSRGIYALYEYWLVSVANELRGQSLNRKTCEVSWLSKRYLCRKSAFGKIYRGDGLRVQLTFHGQLVEGGIWTLRFNIRYVSSSCFLIVLILVVVVVVVVVQYRLYFHCVAIVAIVLVVIVAFLLFWS